MTAGFIVVAAFLWLSRPTPLWLATGGAIALVGLGVRAWAAGHLRKNQQLATSGPYAHVRNPLYVGTLLTGLGFAVAGANPLIGAVLVGFFLLFYLPVVEEEESHLAKILPGFDEYRRRVPRLLPKLAPQYSGGPPFSGELYLKNREYQAFLGFLLVIGLLSAKVL